MYAILRKFLFTRSPEAIHYWAMRQLHRIYKLPGGKILLQKQFRINHPSLHRTLWGLDFPNPVGLAAGFDKDARWVDELATLGFGFMEIGTVTPKPQSGNEQPRLFRLPQDAALINRMGFNNAGSGVAASRLRHRKSKIIVGGNIGKNKLTPNENAIADYEAAFRDLYPVVDYFVVNVSSPNTPGLRELQDKKPLMDLLSRLKVVNDHLKKPKPILLKIAPDLTDAQLDDIIFIVQQTHIDGVVATNTTIERENLKTTETELEEIGAGGLSGAPLKKRSTEIVAYIYQKSNGQIPIIACGGIFNAEDAEEKLKAGAVLVQVYTGFIYEGPSIAKKICNQLIQKNQ